MSDRCHLVAFNCGRIQLLLESFQRVRNFRPDRDRLIVLDCSPEPDRERDQLQRFTRERRWRPGREPEFLRRENWGLAEGARIDYFLSLQSTPRRPDFVWQFQDHFLDHESAASRWPPGTSDIDGTDLSGRPRADTIPDAAVIDLDFCAEVLAADSEVGVLYAGRDGVGMFERANAPPWFYVDGANFGVRSASALRAFHPGRLEAYRRLYDGSYEWALFMEFEWGRMLTDSACRWFDLESGARFSDPETLREAQASRPGLRTQRAPAEYRPIYERFAALLSDDPRPDSSGEPGT